MVFTKKLRDGVRSGEITTSIRIWKRLHVKVGGRYRMDEGEIEIDSIEPIGFPDITPQHGSGENIYLIRFHYIAPPRVKANKTA